jgi:hypothetical protein
MTRFIIEEAAIGLGSLAHPVRAAPMTRAAATAKVVVFFISNLLVSV